MILAAVANQVLSGQGLVVDFEDIELASPAAAGYAGGGAYYNGSDLAGGFTSNGVHFENLYNADWGSWSGWSWSTTTDVETPGYTNQYSAFAGGAASGEVYAVAYLDAFNSMNPLFIDLPAGWQAPQSLSVTNTTYTALTIRDGDGFGFASPFGQGDYYRLTIQGLTEGGEVAGTVIHDLADFTGSGETVTIQDTWMVLDLSTFGGNIDRLSLLVESTDVGFGGMNTPAYIAVDDLVLGVTAVPEPGAVAVVMGIIGLMTVLWRRR